MHFHVIKKSWLITTIFPYKQFSFRKLFFIKKNCRLQNEFFLILKYSMLAVENFNYRPRRGHVPLLCTASEGNKKKLEPIFIYIIFI